MDKIQDPRELRRRFIAKKHQDRNVAELRSRYIYIKDGVVVDILKHRGHFGNRKGNPNVIEFQKIFSTWTVAGRAKCRKYIRNCTLVGVIYQFYESLDELRTIIVIPALAPGIRNCRCNVLSIEEFIKDTEEIKRDIDEKKNFKIK